MTIPKVLSCNPDTHWVPVTQIGGRRCARPQGALGCGRLGEGRRGLQWPMRLGGPWGRGRAWGRVD